MKQAVIFDFDGTIADSFDYVFDFMWQQAGKKHIADRAEKDSYRHMHMRDMARRMGVAWWKLPILYFRGRKRMAGKVRDVKPFTGISEQIKILHEAGFVLYILSASSRQTIRYFLKHYELNEYFKAVYAKAVPFGKEPLIRRMVKRQRLNPANCWMVGDLASDATAAKNQGMRSLAVSWGFEEREPLVRVANFVVDKPEAISKTILGVAGADTI